MALGDYCSIFEYKQARRINDEKDDAEITRLIPLASRMVDNYCGRTFYQDAGTSVRTFDPPSGDTLIVDDISTTTGLIVTDFGNTLTLGSDFELLPTGAFTNAGEAGTYYMLRKFYNLPWYAANRGASVSVTARWGWATTPPAVKQATIVQLADLLAGRDNNFGVIGIDVGTALKVRMNTIATLLLATYRRGDMAPGFGFA